MISRNVRLHGLMCCAVTMLGLLSSCKKNPIERLADPYGDAAVPELSGVFVIYDDELKTGGGVGFIPFGENQSLDVSDKTSPRRNINQMRYTWTGAATSSSTGGGFQHDFAGFTLLSSPDVGSAASTPGRNLAAANYSQVKFWVRGALSSENRLRIEGPDDGDPTTGSAAMLELSASQLSDWQEVTLAVPSRDFENVKAFLTVSIQYEQPPRSTPAGHGGTVFLDDIRYE